MLGERVTCEECGQGFEFGGAVAGRVVCDECLERRRGVCKHPADRLYAWVARDDRAKPTKMFHKGGQVFCVACCECGAVLAGGE